MTFAILRIESTPNPNAVKCILDRRISEVPRSFLSPADAGDDPLIAALFAIPGVRNILTLDDWITVGKQPDAAWPPIQAQVRRVLKSGPPSP